MNKPVHNNEHRRKRFNKKCPFVSAGWKTIDYKDTETLKNLLRKEVRSYLEELQVSLPASKVFLP
ncbi:30S ribosomal protein S18 [Chlamydia psittaci Mat116]|nr:30S ribosomal protein S18 [Chlamydia psittaci Mat116]